MSAITPLFWTMPSEERLAPEAGLRWNEGVLEQCYVITYFDAYFDAPGSPFKRVTEWRPVPQARP